MRYLIWFLRIVLFLLLLGFTVRNVETVTLHYYFGYEWHGASNIDNIIVFHSGGGDWRSILPWQDIQAKAGNRFIQEKISGAG